MTLEVHSPDGIGEVDTSTDLVGAIIVATELREGDVVVITSKVVSKSEGRVVAGERERAIDGETLRVVARRGPTRIVENTQGLVMAAAGVDASNVSPGQLVLLPVDPDASARALRRHLRERAGLNLAVVISDTAGRPWRIGQTDIAIGCAGILPTQDFAGSTDAYGNPLRVTAPAVADEVAGMAELSSGKLGGRPVSVVRGLAGRVLPPEDDGPGARSLQRPPTEDMFAMGTREAVEAALRHDPVHFGAPAPPDEFAEALARCEIPFSAGAGGIEVPAAAAVRADVLASAYGWERSGNSLLFQQHH